MRFLPFKTIRARFQELVNQSSEVDIAVAWIGASSVLSSSLVAAGSKKTSFRIVTGLGGYLTDTRILEQVAAVTALRVFGTATSPLFHPKLYLFRNSRSQTVWIGSQNWTHAGFSTNVETTFELSDHSRVATREFLRFWDSNQAQNYAEWNPNEYESRRKKILAAAKQAGIEDAFPDAAVIQAVSADVLHSGWSSYVERLRKVGTDREGDFKLANWLTVLAARKSFINRNWEDDLTEDDLAIMYGQRQYAPFGRLMPIKQARFKGAEGKSKRLRIGALLQEASRMKRFEEPLAQKVFERLCELPDVGSALASRLLVLANPEIFVVVNKKSFQGLGRELNIPVPRSNIPAKSYAELLRKIQSLPWCASSMPSEPSERDLWLNRAALLDPLVYNENPEQFDD